MNADLYKRAPIFCAGVFCLCFASGCQTGLTEAQTQCRILSEQNKAQLAEIENMKIHNSSLEKQLTRSEEDIALLKEQVDLDRRQITSYEREHSELYEQFKTLAGERARSSVDDLQQTEKTQDRTLH